MRELDLAGPRLPRGLRRTGGLFVPFEDGSSIQLWNDDERCEEEIRRFAPGDLAGWRAMHGGEAPAARRPPARRRRTTSGSARRPTREEIERRLGGDAEARGAALRVVDGRAGRAVPRRRAAAARLSRPGSDRHQREPARPRHRVDLLPPRVGPDGRDGRARGATCEGGMGMVSFILCDIAREAGRRRGRRACRSRGSCRARGRAGVGRADPGAAASSPTPTRERRSRCWAAAPTRRGPAGRADPDRGRDGQGEHDAHRAAQLHRPARHARAAPHRPGEHAAHQGRSGATHPPAANEGVLPPRTWNELYLQTVLRPERGAAGMHTLSVFAQYVPQPVHGGDWDTRREEVGRTVVDSIARFCSNLPGARSSRSRCSVRRTSSGGWGSPAGTSSRARSCRTTCGTGGCRPGRRCRASSSAARGRIRAGA